MDLGNLYGFPIERSTHTRARDERDVPIIISGAFVDVPSNANFSMLDENTRSDSSTSRWHLMARPVPRFTHRRSGGR